MLHNIIIGLILLGVLACIVVLVTVKSEDKPRKLPADLEEKYRNDSAKALREGETRFYRAVSSTNGLPPVPAPQRRESETTTIPRLQASSTNTTFIPSLSRKR